MTEIHLLLVLYQAERYLTPIEVCVAVRNLMSADGYPQDPDPLAVCLRLLAKLEFERLVWSQAQLCPNRRLAKFFPPYERYYGLTPRGHTRKCNALRQRNKVKRVSAAILEGVE